MTTLYGYIANETEKEPEYNLGYFLLNNLQRLPNAIGTAAGFEKNYIDMQENPVYGGDKYHHAKANFNAGQHYNFVPAIALDLVKEMYDIPTKTWGHKKNGLSLKENIGDSLQDLQADFYGLFQGATHPFGNPQVLLEKIRPVDLNPRF